MLQLAQANVATTRDRGTSNNSIHNKNVDKISTGNQQIAKIAGVGGNYDFRSLHKLRECQL